MQNDIINFIRHRLYRKTLGDSVACNSPSLRLHFFERQINGSRTFSRTALEFAQPSVEIVHQKRPPRTADSDTCDDRNSKFGFKLSDVYVEPISRRHIHHVKNKNDGQAVVFGLQHIM